MVGRVTPVRAVALPIAMARPPRAKEFCGRLGDRPYHLGMERNVAIIGAGVSGLTCGVVFAERGYRTAIFAKDIGQQTTSGAAAAVWFPYHVEPAERVIPLALETYQVLLDLARFPESGVSIIESRQFLRTGEIEIPDWAIPLGRCSRAFTGAMRALSERDPCGKPDFEPRAAIRSLCKRFLAARPSDGHHDLSRLPRRALSQGRRRNPRERPLRKTRRCRYQIRSCDQLRRDRRARACA